MQGFMVRQAGRLVLGLLGAVLVAAAIAAAGDARAHTLPGVVLAYCDRLSHFARLDLGISAVTGMSVLDELAANLPPTLALVALGALAALLVGVPLGLLLALGPARRLAAPLVQVITATPVFCSGLALAFIAVHGLHWPVSVNATVGASEPAEQVLFLLALPVLTVGLAGAAAVQLALRRAAVQSSGEAFRTGLKRMGLGGIEIETIYVLPTVFAGLFASAGEIMLALQSAAVVAEWVFHRAGAADLFVKSVALADWNLAAILLFVSAVATFLADFLGKVFGRMLTPELRA